MAVEKICPHVKLRVLEHKILVTFIKGLQTFSLFETTGLEAPSFVTNYFVPRFRAGARFRLAPVTKYLGYGAEHRRHHNDEYLYDI